MSKLYAQGDVLLELVADGAPSGEIVAPDADGAVVLARGELTGHRHAFYACPGRRSGGDAVMFRDETLARDIPANLYVGHVRLTAPAELRHEEHATIPLPAGTYRVRRQREFDAGETRVVAD